MRRLAPLLALALAGALPAAAQPPARVVSMNLCTDQLAMLIAAPGQLVSVSHVARDPVSSALAEQAQAYPVNHGSAEEIFLLAPTSSSRAPSTAPPPSPPSLASG